MTIVLGMIVTLTFALVAIALNLLEKNMTKEELQKLIKETNDDRILEALWELYELKFTQIKYIQKDITTIPQWNNTYVPPIKEYLTCGSSTGDPAPLDSKLSTKVSC